MSLSLASSIAQTSLANTAAQTSIVSRNIDGVNDPNYSRKIVNLTTSSTGGGELVSATRAANRALFDNMLVAQSGAASESALADGLNKLDQTVGDPANGQSISALIGSLSSALQTYSASPNDTTVAQTAVMAASNLSNALNAATTTVQGVRAQADADMATSVQTINQLLTQFQGANSTVVNGLATGADVSDAQDSRDAILSQLSQQLGITTSTGPNGSVSIYTDSGVTLFQGTARAVTFQQTGTYGAGTTGNAVFVGGVPITGSSSPMPLQSGKLAGLANLRDNVAITYQNQLDETARADRCLRRDGPDRRRSACPARPVHDGGRDRAPAQQSRQGARRPDHHQSERRSEPGRQRQPLARRRDLGPQQPDLALHLQHHRKRELHRGASSSSSVDSRRRRASILRPGSTRIQA